MWRPVVTRLVFSLQILVESFKEGHKRRDITISDLDPREFLITLANLPGSCKRTQPLHLGERAFQGREAARVHIRLREGQVTKRGRLERRDHSPKKAVI